jgi:hypothetical protein
MQPVKMLSVVVFEDLRAKSFQPPDEEQKMLCLLNDCVACCVDRDNSLEMWTPRNLKLSTRSTTDPSMWMGVCSALCFLPVAHNQLIFQVKGEVVVLATHCQATDLPPIGCLLMVGDQANHRHVQT